MKINKLITTAAVVLASSALFLTAASAQVNTASAAGDLILGFETGLTTDEGASTNVEVNLGLDTTFIAAASADVGQVINLSSDLSVSDLSVYGDNPSDLFFGVVGTNGNTAGTSDIFVTSTTGAAFNNSTTQNQTIAGVVETIYGGYNGGTQGVGATTSIVSGAGGTGTYSKIAFNENGKIDNNSEFSSGTTSLYNADASVTMDVYEDLRSSTGTATLLGTLTLDEAATDGADTLFTAVGTPQIPEPSTSTFALIGLGALAMIFAIRRRNALKA